MRDNMLKFYAELVARIPGYERKPMNKTLIFLFLPFFAWSQSSIKPADIEIHTQLTLLQVGSTSVGAFENQLGALAHNAVQLGLGEDYDWLTYTTETGDYLIVTFSKGIHDVLTLEGLRTAFANKQAAGAFDGVMEELKELEITPFSNYVKQMLLPWSTVTEISVAEHPLATMEELSVSVKDLEEFDLLMRKLVALLHQTEYPYPLESSRGSLGAYGKVTWVWFYADREEFEGANALENWMRRKGRSTEFKAIADKLSAITHSRKVYRLNYQTGLSN